MQCLTMSPSTLATPGGGGTTRQPSSTASSSIVGDRSSTVDGGTLTELDLLRKIYDEICDIRRQHADIIAETASKKAANQRYLEEHNSKLRQLESEHRETGRRLKESTETDVHIADDVLASLTGKYQAEREELDALRRTIDDIEFVMFEADTHYDEDKERIQQQLMEKQQALLNIENQYQQVNRLSELAVSPPGVVEVNAQPDNTSYNTSHLTVFNESKDDHLDVSTPSLDVDFERQVSPQRKHQSDIVIDSTIAEIYTLANSVLHAPDDDRLTVQHTTDAVVNSCDMCCHKTEVESSPRFIQSLPSPKTQPLPDCLPFPPGRVDRLRVDHRDRECGSGEWNVGGDSEDGASTSTTSSERVLEQHHGKKIEVDERIARIRALLAAAEAEKAQLLRYQAQSDDDEMLRDQTQDRLRRRLEVDFDLCAKRLSDDVSVRNDDDASVVQRRDTRRTVQSRQSRPLTRYLPVRDQPLDLLRFLGEQAGHSLDRCADDITVTSDTARGFLVKMGGRIRTWRRRLFVFDRVRRQLAYYVDGGESRRPRGVIDFRQIEDVYVFDLASSVKSPAPELTFCVKTAKRTYYIVAPNVEVRQLWMEIVFTGAEGYRQFE